jgi:hypothetical protein
MSKLIRRSRGIGAACALTSTLTHVALAAPSGAHPRLWLDSGTLAGLQAQVGVKDSPVERGATRCAAARTNPSDYSDGGWQGFEFLTTLSGCLASWAASGSADDLETAIKYWNVLLDDYQTVGDGAGGDDVVTHDTGYAMRTFAPYSALAYDWLHDAPGVTETLRAHARERFDAWVTYYAANGYLNDMAGANYEAGYAFAATLIAIAEGGEAGSAGDNHWSIVKDTIWGKDLAAGLAAGGVLEGGDWAEGWQYGPLSVLELALAARAMGDNGVPIANASTFADSLVLRFAHGLTPSTEQAFVGGDTEDDTPERMPDNSALLAAIAGPGSDQGKALARGLNQELALENDNPLFDAIASARSGASAVLPSDVPTNYLGKGVGNWYVRGAWAKDTAWGVFQCSRRLVADHQHNDAGNFVLTRGADDLVVDPSPYGTLSTLTSNAPAVDSNSLPDGYSPSQGNWGKTTQLTWARQSTSGVAVARCDYADQFRPEDYPSDVAVALRDFVLVPDGGDGEVVLVDRVVTGDATRGLHLRVRTPGELSLSGDRANATVGASALEVEHVWSSSGTPSVREMPQASECPSSDHQCDVSRLPSGSEYRIDVAGPSALAIHVVAARSAAASAHQLLAGQGFRGVVVPRASGAVAVVTNDAADGALAATLAYEAPANAVHVVVDAPVDGAGKSDVSATRDGTNCRVSVSPHQGSSSGYDGKPLIVHVDANCAVADDGVQTMPASMGMGGSPGTGGALGSAGMGPGPVVAAAGGEGGTSDGSGESGQGGGGDTLPSGGKSAVTGGAGQSLGTGGKGYGAAGGGGSPAIAGASAAPQATGPIAPDLKTGCSVSPSPSPGGGSSAFASAFIGLLLLARTRRRADCVRR